MGVTGAPFAKLITSQDSCGHVRKSPPVVPSTFEVSHNKRRLTGELLPDRSSS
jgi:hypothetical protein